MMFTGVAGLSYLALNNYNQSSSFLQNTFKGFSSTVEAEETKSAFKEHEIPFLDELQEGEMRELKVGPKDEDKVLISKYQGKIHSVGNFCPHFGAPLSWGVLFEDKVLCPWHGAGFNIVTGAVEGAPVLDGLPKYEVISKDGKTYVKVPDPLPKN